MRNKIAAAKQAIWNNRVNIMCVSIPLTMVGGYALGAYYDLQTARTQLEMVRITDTREPIEI